MFKMPVVVDLYDFVTNGIFDCIKIGQTKEWILSNFPDPDYTENGLHITKKGNIWTYGNIEFHFVDNILNLIFCDNFVSLDILTDKITDHWDAGRHIDLNKWIFVKANSLKCNEIMTILNQARINFSLFHSPNLRSAVIRILKSNVELVFEKENDCIDEDTNFRAFSLASKDVSSHTL
jgi:hypothetical protein